MRILILHRANLYRFLVVESGDRDGSLSVIVSREDSGSTGATWGSRPGEQQPLHTEYEKPRPKNKRITVHQSGRINYHENRRSIFIEPLTRTTQVVCIYGYRIPGVQKLDAFSDPVDVDDAVFDLSELGDGPVSFSFFIGPKDMVPSGRAMKLAYGLEGYALAVSVDGQAISVPQGYENHFTTLCPECGPYPEQKIDERQAMIFYHQAITGSQDLILYPPNGEGGIKLIFSVPMMIAPAFKIELVDPALHVTDQDVQRDGRSDTVMLRFKVRHRSTGQIIRQPVAFRSIELDARL